MKFAAFHSRVHLIQKDRLNQRCFGGTECLDCDDLVKNSEQNLHWNTMFWKTKKKLSIWIGYFGIIRFFLNLSVSSGLHLCFFRVSSSPFQQRCMKVNQPWIVKHEEWIKDCERFVGVSGILWRTRKQRQFGMGWLLLVLHEYSCPMGSNNHNWQPGNALKSSLLVICLSVGCKSLCMPGIFHACFDDLIFPFLKGRHVHVFRWGGVFIYVEYPKVQDAKPNMMTRFIRSPLTLWIHDIVFVYDSIFSNWLDWCDFHPPIFFQGWMDVFVFWHHVWISLWSELHLTPWNRIARYIFKSFTVITLLNWGSKKPSFSKI